jgi:hypothetical protein
VGVVCCWLQTGFWGGSKNTAGAFLDSSEGFTFSNESAAVRPSRVITVNIPSNNSVTTCEWWLWGKEALDAVNASGIDHNLYTYK